MSEPEGKKKRVWSVGLRLVVLMAVIASCLFLVVGICAAVASRQ
jgi:hypothetical protein